MSQPAGTSTKPLTGSRLPLRFSLRVLLLAVTAFAIGFPAWYRWPYTEEELQYPSRRGQPDKTQPPNGRVVTTWQRQWGGGRSKNGGQWIYYDGQLNTFVTLRDGVRHGPFVNFGHSRREGMYSDGEMHGEIRRFQNDELVEVTNYHRGRKEGPYQKFHRGRIQVSGQYTNGWRDGTWVRFDESGRELAQVTYRIDREHRIYEFTRDGSTCRIVLDEQKRPTEIFLNGEVVEDRLARLLAAGQIVSRFADPINELSDIEFLETPVEDAVDFLAAKHECPMLLDPLHVDRNQTITEGVTGLPFSSTLAILTARHGLGCDFRYGCIWITSAEDAKDWRDPTGISEIEPPQDSQLANSWNRAAEIQVIDMPLAEAVKKLVERFAINVDVSAVEAADERAEKYAVTLTRKGLEFHRVLGNLLYNARCRCELRGETLVILPQEAQ